MYYSFNQFIINQTQTNPIVISKTQPTQLPNNKLIYITNIPLKFPLKKKKNPKTFKIVKISLNLKKLSQKTL